MSAERNAESNYGRHPTAEELAYYTEQGDPYLAFAASHIAFTPCFCTCRFNAACHCDNFGVCNCPDEWSEDALRALPTA